MKVKLLTKTTGFGKSIDEIFEDTMSLALSITDDEAKLTDGMSEKVSKKYRDFSKMSKEDQLKEVLEGNV